jgi:hypothetical protein
MYNNKKKHPFLDREIDDETQISKVQSYKRIPDGKTAGLCLDFGAIVRRLRMEERRASSHAMDIHARAVAKSQI